MDPKTLFTSPYDQKTFIQLLKGDNKGNKWLLGEEYQDEERYVTKEIWHGFEYLTHYSRLGEIELDNNWYKEQVLVLEITQKSINDARVSITKETIKLLKKDIFQWFYTVLVTFKSDANPDNWRFSLIKSNDGKTWNNARRFSYKLWLNEWYKTPKQYLVDKWVVKDLTDLVDRFDVEVVREEFFNRYINLFLELYKEVNKNKSIINLNTVAFTKKLLWKIIFLYFLQKKNRLWAPADKPITEWDPKFMEKLYADYIGERKFVIGEKRNFYNDYLEPLFYKALSEERKKEAWSEKIDIEVFKDFWIKVPYLNGGLFQKEYNREWTKFEIDDKVFRNDKQNGILDVFDLYNFTIYEDDPYDREIAVDPEMLGKIFENMISISSDNINEIIKLFDSKKNWINGKEIAKDINKKFGAYYTPREVVHYITKEALLHHIINHLKEVRKHLSEDELHGITRGLFNAKEQHLSKEYLKEKQDADQSEYDRFESVAIKINDILKTVKVLDPAVWSGAFPMGILIEIFGLRVYLRDTFHLDTDLTNYDIKKSIIENNVFWVDIEPWAIDIARLRFWLSLVVDASQPEPLPNLEFKFVSANTLGILGSVNEKGSFDNLDFKKYKEEIKKYYNPTTQEQKEKRKKTIEDILFKADHMLEKSQRAAKLLTFKPFTQGSTASFFDSELMFDEKQFDIIIGNPPYSGITNNPGLYEDDKTGVWVYKYVDWVHFWERKHWLNDDYVKFFRFAEHQMEQQKLWVVAMITNHWYIDNPTFRGMRRHLMQTYNQIINVDLHGNAKKKEVCPDWSKDENVFDIQQWVAMNIMVRNKSLTQKMLHKHWYWLRKYKLNEICSSTYIKNNWNELDVNSPLFLFINQDQIGSSNYQLFFSINDMFYITWSWVTTMWDSFCISTSKEQLSERIKDFIWNSYSEKEIKDKYDLGKNYPKWIIENKHKLLYNYNKIIPITYRPFDNQFYYVDDNIIRRLRKEVSKNFIQENIWLSIWRQWWCVGSKTYDVVFVSDSMVEFNLFRRWGEQIYPLYFYDENNISDKKINIKEAYIDKYQNHYQLIDSDNIIWYKIIQYIYSILHCPFYRDKFKEFLKSDFPRIPLVKTKEEFEKLAELWSKLTKLHLLEEVASIQWVGDFTTKWSNIVEKVMYKEWNLYINKDQYFSNISEEVREFTIGWYQVLDKWLKSRKGRVLTDEDVLHLQKVARSLSHTIDVMKKIDEVVIEGGCF
jgi:hypothetical protein